MSSVRSEQKKYDKNRVNPHHMVLIAVLLSVLLMLANSYLSLSHPVLGVQFTTADEQLVLVDGKEQHIITAIGATPDNLLALEVTDLRPEPDVLETYAQFNRFMMRQTQISGLLQNEVVWFQDADGQLLERKLRQRSISDLPVSFYVQQVAGFLCVLICSAILAFNPKALEARIYWLMGFGITLACWTSAVYTTRELAIDGTLFSYLSTINHFGAAMFGGGLIALFSCYPCRLVKPQISWLFCLTFVVIWLNGQLQLTETTAMGFHIWLLVDVLVAFFLAFLQWRATRYLPAERAILKWLLLSVMGTTMIFTLMNILPAVITADTIGEQAFTLSGFTLGVVMMALGLSRYKLFNLDKWWYQYWTWFFAGIVVLVIDIALLSLLHVNQGLALGLSVAVVGWLYIPVRHGLWQWIRPGAEKGIQHLLPDILKQLFAVRYVSDIPDAFQVILQKAFSPLILSRVDDVEKTQLDSSGIVLLVASLDGKAGWKLQHAAQGKRLFNQQDLVLANTIHTLVAKAFEAIQAREEGVMAERNRIKRDLHDDLGARLLGMIHSEQPGQTQQQARQAMAELRSILNALEQEPCDIEEAFAIWQSEMRERLQQSAIELDWQQSLQQSGLLTARTRHNLGRILRELTSNVVKHSDASQVSVRVHYADKQLQLSVSDNGQGFSVEQHSEGLGRKIVESRITELDGQVSWQVADSGGCLVQICLTNR